MRIMCMTKFPIEQIVMGWADDDSSTGLPIRAAVLTDWQKTWNSQSRGHVGIFSSLSLPFLSLDRQDVENC